MKSKWLAAIGLAAGSFRLGERASVNDHNYASFEKSKASV